MGFAARYIELRTFAAKTFQTVENNRERFSVFSFPRANAFNGFFDAQNHLLAGSFSFLA
jgi:hypothetical protein